ncbi:MAG: acyl-CoA reductase [Tenericutes bacterium]|jgi:hypothetical protein|nr:acyl-CoA reductase [Mycoplasmatota bacterium]
MILYQGEIFTDELQMKLIDQLKIDCYQTINHSEELNTMEVINACDILARKVKAGEYNDIILPLLTEFDIPYDYFIESIPMFEKDSLIKKCEIELGNNFEHLPDLDKDNRRKICPLGILFHIAAGNVDVLPAYSVIEGLLAGNINILKLPSGDRGMSVKLLSELINIEPKLKNYIYVFDVPSTETETLKIFADIADAIIVWGGDVAVKAARSMASVNTKIIEWGHKLSFAYATLDASEKDLKRLAGHIAMTNQVLCSSCQGIFVDSKNMDQVKSFAKKFFDILVEESKKHKLVSLGMRGKNTIEIYNAKLEQHETHQVIYDEKGMSVIVSDDHELELSMLFRNVWVKSLPREIIIEKIKPHKNHLQTASLLCNKEDVSELSDKLAKAGIIRVTKAGDMSRIIVGESHDGKYALREYSRIVELAKTT